MILVLKMNGLQLPAAFSGFLLSLAIPYAILIKWFLGHRFCFATRLLMVYFPLSPLHMLLDSNTLGDATVLKQVDFISVFSI